MYRTHRLKTALIAPLLLLALKTNLARADTTASVSVSLEGQQQSNWCWVTAADMVMSHFSSHVNQCQEVNQALGRTDCCNASVPSACNVGGFAGTPLSYFGFSYQQSVLNYTQITQEIDAGRPVQIGYSWNGGGGHALVIRGYYTYSTGTSTQWLLIDDPLPVGGSGSEYWITYNTYVGGASPTYDHTAQAPLHHIASSPVCSSTFVDVPSANMQRCFDDWTARNKQLVSLSATHNAAGDVISGSFQPSNGSGWYAKWLMSASDYQTDFNTYSALGFRPLSVNVLSTASGPYFNTIWTPAEAGYLHYFGLSSASLSSNDSTLRAQGYVPVDLSAYDDAAGNPNFAATWLHAASAGQAFDTGLSGSAYQTLFNQQTAAGKRPSRFSAYTSGGSTVYAVLWKNSTSGFFHYFGLSPAGVSSKDATLAAQGYALTNVSALNDTYSGIWTR